MKPYQNNVLYSFDLDVALKGRNLKFDFKNMWLKNYSNFETNSLVLFNKDKFKVQWKDKNPMNNWNLMEQNYELKVLESLDDGWVLYKITSKKQYDAVD